jgi:hypothetical protein
MTPIRKRITLALSTLAFCSACAGSTANLAPRHPAEAGTFTVAQDEASSNVSSRRELRAEAHHLSLPDRNERFTEGPPANATLRTNR